MANYTKTVYSSESEVQVGDRYTSTGSYISHTDGGTFHFSFDDVKEFTINSINITAPITYTTRYGSETTSNLKLGSTTVASYGVTSGRNSWSASGFSISASAATLDIKNDTSIHNVSGTVYGRATAIISYSADLSVNVISPLDGENIASSLSNMFTWTNICPAGNVVSTKLYWKYINETNFKSVTVGTNDTEYIFPASTFNNNTIQWYVEIADSSGNVATSSIQTVVVGITPTVEIAYPNNVNIRNTNKQIFTWEMSESIATGQKAYELQYKPKSSSQWTTIRRTSSKQYHEFDANTFGTDTYDWKLKVTNNDDISTEYVTASFVAIGATGAPNITNITNSSIPTIRWEIASQDTFEIELYSGSERIYVSGVQVGANVREFTPNIMLEDGNYIVKMRSMNEYGYFTEWSDYAFVLSPQKPEAVECMVYANECHGVNVMMISGNAESLYVLRRKFGELSWNILGKLKSDEVFVDNTTMTGVKYEYALRNYRKAAGYTDSNVVSMIIEHQGSIVYDGSDFVLLYKTEDAEFQISHTPAKSYSDSYMIGRKYPVRESSEWMAHTTSLSCFILFGEYETLERFYESNDALWFKGDNFSFKCSIDSIQIKETLLGKGYTIGIDLSRMDENEVNLLE